MTDQEMYDRIVKKLGFKPGDEKLPAYTDLGTHDDRVSPYSVLTEDESEFLFRRLQKTGHL